MQDRKIHARELLFNCVLAHNTANTQLNSSPPATVLSKTKTSKTSSPQDYHKIPRTNRMAASWQPEIEAMVIMESPSDPANVEVQLEIVAEPLVQEAHRTHYIRSTHRTVHYDPNSASKRKIRALVKHALEEVGYQSADFPIFRGNRALLMQVTYNVHNMSKDCDNLQKFMQDALQEVVYGNDKFLCDIHMKKHFSDDLQDQSTYISVRRLLWTVPGVVNFA